MGNRTNIDYIRGTTARRIDCISNDALIVSYDSAANVARQNTALLCGNQLSRIDRQSQCAAQLNYGTITKGQYLFGAFFCFAGSVLTYFLGVLF